ncbi:MAG: lipid-A-disaccharide synthase [Paludibacteraceae bacterium]|nr:lipid-A-disaccharide synthase [Paludibacteraceae bacterium]
MAKYFIIAGEASGDAHASALMREIERRDHDASFSGMGGDQMEKAGCHLYRHIRHMAFMGFAAVMKHWHEVQTNFRIAHHAIRTERPDVLILIDYPSFNLRMAKFCRRHLPKTKIFYYIPPKVWAWKRRRIHAIARLCDEVLGIFPFEPDFYAKYGYSCTYVGNPTAEAIDHLGQQQQSSEARKPQIAILPGSRPSEITHCLPRMLDAAHCFKNYDVVICAAPGIDNETYTPYLSAHDTLTRETYTTLLRSSAAIVNSGTATLETALLGCPQVAVYHLACSRLIGLIRSWAQPLLFSIPYFTLVNIISGKEVIKEYIANDFTADNVANELGRILTDETYKKEMLASYEHLHILLGSHHASATAAKIITSRP